MPYVFNHLDVIKESLRRSPFGLITDIDGTISQTAPTPQQAEVSPLCRRYLSVLCNHLALVAAISGRPAVQVKSLIDIDGMVYIGSHGLERYRLCHDPQSAERHILATIENSPRARSFRLLPESKYAMNLVTPVNVDRGTAKLA